MVTLCPICTGEYLLGEVLCPSCGCGLVVGSLTGMPEFDLGAAQEVAFTELCRPRLYPLAMLIQQTMEQNGIAAIVKGGHALSVLPHLAFSGELRVMVATARIEYARDIYRAYFEDDYTEGEIDYVGIDQEVDFHPED
jgi:hypothetical protein